MSSDGFRRPAPDIGAQTVQWIAELVGFPQNCGGLLVSDGDIANLVCVEAAHSARSDWDDRELAVYASTSAEHRAWIQKAADLFGLGSGAVRWIPVDADQRMRPSALRRRINADRERGLRPFLVFASAGSSSMGAGTVDPLPEIAEICREFAVWFHVDAVCGALVSQVPGAPDALRGMDEADSIAVDPNEWLCAPVEGACVLVRNPAALAHASLQVKS